MGTRPRTSRNARALALRVRPLLPARARRSMARHPLLSGRVRAAGGWCCTRRRPLRRLPLSGHQSSPVAERESGEHARVFGPRCSGSLASYDPAISSWRTCQLSLFEDSTSSSVTLPRSGSMRNGTVYEHATSVLRMSASASGLWPTPRNTITSLTVMVKAVERQMWPTPRATDADRGGRGDLIQAVRGNSNPHFRRWPAPTASRRSGLQSHGRNAILGPLNPTWLEWLMGFPMDWTVAEHLATRSFLKPPNGLGDESSLSSRSDQHD